MHHHSWLESSDSFTWQPNAAEISPRVSGRRCVKCLSARGRTSHARSCSNPSRRAAPARTNVQHTPHSPRYFSILCSLTRCRTHDRQRRVQQPVCVLSPPTHPLSRCCGDGLHRRESSVSPSHRLRASDDRGAALESSSSSSSFLFQTASHLKG